MSDKLPFNEKIIDDLRERTFEEDVEDEELKWHQDNEDRLVSASHETDWMIQLDNKLPEKLFTDKEIFIPEGVWHRLIKGKGPLKVKIKFL